jgi:hypothetical protein
VSSTPEDSTPPTSPTMNCVSSRPSSPKPSPAADREPTRLASSWMPRSVGWQRIALFMRIVCLYEPSRITEERFVAQKKVAGSSPHGHPAFCRENLKVTWRPGTRTDPSI